jgi:hypothetical protein
MTSLISNRQQPVVAKFDSYLRELQSLANAINDNAIDEQTPLCADLVRHWLRRLDEIETSLFNAQAAVRGE